MHEIWTWDIRTYEWEFLTGSSLTLYPPPREQHSAVVIQGDLFIFGGKSRIYPGTTDQYYNDLWQLHISHPQPFTFHWAGEVLPIPASSRMYAMIMGADTTSSDPDLAQKGLCIQSVSVKVCVLFLLVCVCMINVCGYWLFIGDYRTCVLQSTASVINGSWA